MPDPPVLRLLIVSPDRGLAGLLARTLSPRGVEVLHERGAREALKKAIEIRPGAVLIDSRPDERQSLTIVGALRRALPATTALVWYSSPITRQKVAAAVEAGASGVISRPSPIPTLLEGIVRALRRVRSDAGEATDRSVPEPRERPPAEEVFEALEKIEELKAAPFILERVLTITADDESGATDLEKVIEKDQNTATVVLKRANSALFAASRPITRIVEAITRLGFSEVRSLVLTLSVIQEFLREQSTLGFEPYEYWRFCVARGVLARALARQSGSAAPEAAFICGLLLDIGKAILDEHFNERFQQAIELSASRRIDLVHAERGVLGTDHAEVGKWLFERWNFPDLLRQAVATRSIRDVERAEPELRRGLRIVWIADTICRALGLGDSGERTIVPLDEETLRLASIFGRPRESFWTPVIEAINDSWSALGTGHPTASAPGGDPLLPVFLYEETAPSLSIIRLTIEGAGLAVTSIKSQEEIRLLQPMVPAVFVFDTIDGLRRAAEANPRIGDRPWVLILPPDHFPADDEVKQRVGLPVGRCTYLGLPVDARRLAGLVAGVSHEIQEESE